MAQVRARDHAYSPDAAALRAPTVPVSSSYPEQETGLCQDGRCAPSAITYCPSTGIFNLYTTLKYISDIGIFLIAPSTVRLIHFH